MSKLFMTTVVYEKKNIAGFFLTDGENSKYAPYEYIKGILDKGILIGNLVLVDGKIDTYPREHGFIRYNYIRNKKLFGGKLTSLEVSYANGGKMKLWDGEKSTWSRDLSLIENGSISNIIKLEDYSDKYRDRLKNRIEAVIERYKASGGISRLRYDLDFNLVELKGEVDYIEIDFTNKIKELACQELRCPNIVLKDIVELDKKAFSLNSYIRLVVANELEFVGESAFENSGITTIKLNRLKSIGEYAFAHCILLKKLELPSSIEKVGDYFLKDSAVEELRINSEFDITGNCLSGANSLSLVVLGKDLDRSALDSYERALELLRKSGKLRKDIQIVRE